MLQQREEPIHPQVYTQSFLLLSPQDLKRLGDQLDTLVQGFDVGVRSIPDRKTSEAVKVILLTGVSVAHGPWSKIYRRLGPTLLEPNEWVQQQREDKIIGTSVAFCKFAFCVFVWISLSLVLALAEYLFGLFSGWWW